MPDDTRPPMPTIPGYNWEWRYPLRGDRFMMDGEEQTESRIMEAPDDYKHGGKGPRWCVVEPKPAVHPLCTCAATLTSLCPVHKEMTGTPARVIRNRLSPVQVADLRDWLKDYAPKIHADTPYESIAQLAMNAIPGATITANNIKGMWKALGLPNRRAARKPEPTAELAQSVHVLHGEMIALRAEVAELRKNVRALAQAFVYAWGPVHHTMNEFNEDQAAQLAIIRVFAQGGQP